MDELKYIDTEPQEFELKIYNENNPTLYLAMGISEDRSDEIIDIAVNAYKEGGTFAESMQLLVSKLNHFNEIIFGALIVGKIHNDQKRSSENTIAELEQKLKTVELLTKLMKHAR